MNFIHEGMRLKNALTEETCFAYAWVWKKYADQNELAAFMASMLLLCEQSGIDVLHPVEHPDDIYRVIVGMLH